MALLVFGDPAAEKVAHQESPLTLAACDPLGRRGAAQQGARRGQSTDGEPAGRRESSRLSGKRP
jgi:hypothetical protein